MWRKIMDWCWYKDANTTHFFNYILMKATHKDINLFGVDLKKGQLIFGRHKASEETGLSHRSIRTAITRLKTTSEMTIKSTNRFSIITILNYDIYQSSKDINDHQNDHQNDKQTTSKRPANDHIQEHKNIRSKDMGFELFYSKYPKKKAKTQALKAFLKLSPNDELLQLILAAVEAHEKTEDWTKEDGKFIPHPATWLSQRRWEDEIKVKEKYDGLPRQNF